MIPAGPGFIPGLPVRGRRHQRRIIGPRAGINESVSDIKQGMSHVRARAALALVCVLVAAAIGSAQPGNRRRIAEVTPIVEANGVHSGTVVRTALQVRLPEGFHVNSHQPRDPALIPLTLAVDAPPHVAVTGTALPTPSDCDSQRTVSMVHVALLARLEAKPGREDEVANLLTSALPLALAEPATTVWFALKLGRSTFGIFDAFPDEAGRQAHLAGQIAAALMAKAPELLAEPPTIEPVEVLAAKL